MKKTYPLIAAVFCASLVSCSKNDDNNNGVLGPDDKVLVKMKINGIAWESRKDNGGALVNSNGQLVIAAVHNDGSGILITVNGITGTGNYNLTAPNNALQFNGAFNINSNISGTSGNLTISEIKDEPNADPARGTFYGTAKNPLNDSVLVITEGEFWGEGF